MTTLLGVPLERSKVFDAAISRIVTEANRLVVLSIDNLPEIMEWIFSPRHILRQMAMIGGLQAFIMGWSTIQQMATWCGQQFTEAGRKAIAVNKRLNNAKTYSEWLMYAEQLDAVRGMDKWRNNDISKLFDNRKLRKRIVDTEGMIKRNNIFDLMFRIRGGLVRDEYGTLDKDLYSVSRAGTKKIIEQYTDTMCKALDAICEADSEDIPDEAKLPFFNEARHAYGRTALMLSGGAYLGYYHMGMFKALYQNKLMPRVISGASAGSLMAVVMGVKTDAELDHIFESDVYSTGGMMDTFRRDFFKLSSKINHPTGHALQQACPKFLLPIMNPLLTLIFDGKFLNYDITHLKEACIFNVGHYTFQEAFDRTGRIINITVTPQNDYDPPRLLNYLMSPHVCVWSAAVASCAIPGIFDAAELIVKEPTGELLPESVSEERRSAAAAAQKGNRAFAPSQLQHQKIEYTDGSIESDLPMQQLSELFNVNHFIISQVNPHSALFSTLSLRGDFNERSFGLRALIGYTHFLKEQCKSWIRDMTLFVLSFKRNAPQWALKRGMFQTITQNYEGNENDITIMPWAGHLSLWSAWTSIIKNPTDEEYLQVLHASELSVWENFSKIKVQCEVEFALDQCVQRLRRKIAEKNVMPDGQSGMEKKALTSAIGERTASFLTSRSILNLSGLSVSDPIVPISATSGGDSDYSESGLNIEDADENPPTPEKRTPSPSITKTTNMANFYYRGDKNTEGTGTATGDDH